MPLPLMMLIVFGSAKLVAELFESLGQSGIAGEILAGIVIGPGLLNWIQPGGLEASLGDLGVIFLLFRVGLEVRSSDLWKIGSTAALVAGSGVALSFVLIWGLFWLWGSALIEGAFVSAGLAATSAGITAQVFASRGLLSERASRLVLASAVIDDICGLLLLAIVTGAASGKADITRVALTVFSSILFVVVIARWGAPAMRRVMPHAGNRLNVGEAEFALSICLLFVLALLSLWTGISAIVGAFLAGLALAESVGRRVKTLVHGATELLVPFFLVGIGLRVDISALRHPTLAALAAGVFVFAVIAKVAGCGTGALSLGFRDALRTGVGMVPRGEVTMVVAQTGLFMGVITRDIFAVVVVAAAATTLAGPMMVRLVFRPAQGRFAPR